MKIKRILTYAAPFFGIAAGFNLLIGVQAYFDTSHQVAQVNGIIPYTNLHPITHTLALKLFSYFGNPLQACVYVQIVAMSLLIGVALASLEERGVSRKVLICLAFLYPLSLRNLFYINNPWKDSLYTICLFGLIILVQKRAYHKKGMSALIGVLLALAALFRHNGILVAIGMLGIFGILQRKNIVNFAITFATTGALLAVGAIVSANVEPNTFDYITYAMSKPIMAVAANGGGG